MTFADYAQFCRKADLLIHDAEFTEEEYPERKGWGHSALPDVLQLAIEAEVKNLGLFHHNQDRSDEAVEAVLQDCRKRLKESEHNITCFAVASGMERAL